MFVNCNWKCATGCFTTAAPPAGRIFQNSLGRTPINSPVAFLCVCLDASSCSLVQFLCLDPRSVWPTPVTAIPSAASSGKSSVATISWLKLVFYASTMQGYPLSPLLLSLRAFTQLKQWVIQQNDPTASCDSSKIYSTLLQSYSVLDTVLPSLMDTVIVW